MALATPNQLYRLNKLGCLLVVLENVGAQGMDHQQADRAIKRAEGTCCGDPADCVCSSLAGTQGA